MSQIDNVIQRARQPGGFSEQRQFTVARERAIHKMREFALADPHYYILELIQATVANGGDHVHIEVDDHTLQFSYVGGGYAREELAQLFDFLFASKEKLEHSDIRQLALGVNALMIMEPTRIIIESGDGTLESTDRIEIRGDQNTVEVGTPNDSLRGTFIRAEGLDRSQISHKSELSSRSYGPPECAAIERRCLSAPVPIIVNNEPVFGYSAQRTPVIFGYNDVVTFDEGDLYGSIGIPEHRHKQSFKLMTFGVWIESTDAALMEDSKIGGVVCYDRLNKTADHSGIVRDEKFEELWARIRPYARQAAEGRAGRGDYRIKELSGEEIPSSELREFFRGGDTFVVVPEETAPDEWDGELAGSIGEALGAPVLRVDRDALDSVSVLAGSNSALLEPDLEAAGDLEFYRREPASPPERPWLTGAVDLDPIDVETLAQVLADEEPAFEEETSKLVDHLGTRTPIRGTVYTPEDSDRMRELYVRLITVDRILWEGPVQSPFPGHILDVHLPAVAPSHLLESVSGDTSFAAMIARTVARRGVDKLRTATRRALENLTMQEDDLPGDTARRIALAALGRSALKRIRQTSSDQSLAGVHFSLIRPQPGPDLLDLQVFEALDGTPYSMRDFEELMEETAGLVYGVVPEVEPDLEGLDTSRILDLDLEREGHLLTIVGEAAYVRVDRRDVIAESGPFRVRDMAIGLRSYPEFPLLVEGDDPAKLEEDRREELVADLVDQLKATYNDDEADAPIRREAIRHLQWFVCRRADADSDAPTYGVEQLPVFLDGSAHPVTFESVLAGLQTDAGLEMVDGRSSDVCELGSVTNSDASGAEPVRQLTMNTWVYRLLAMLGHIRGAFEFDFSEGEAAELENTPSEAFLEDRRIDRQRLDGRVGVPVEPVDQPAVAVIDSDRTKTYRMVRPAVDFGLAGYVHVEEGSVESQWDAIRSNVTRKGTELLKSMLEELPELDSDADRFERAVETVFGFAARQLRLTRNPSGTVTPRIEHPFAQKVLEVPLFPTETGNPVSALRLVREFCADQSTDQSTRQVELAGETPAPLAQWLERHLSEDNIVEPADGPAAPSGESPGGDSLESRLEEWLHRLRPDDHPSRLADSQSPGRDGSPTDADGAEPSPVPTKVRMTTPEDFQQFGRAVDIPEGDCCQYVGAGHPTLYVRTDHPLVRRAKASSDSAAFAWLLLTCYAHVNDVLEPVTNDHELEFQRRVADAVHEL